MGLRATGLPVGLVTVVRLGQAESRTPNRATVRPSRLTAEIANLKYCQVAFHALFFADTYLGPNLRSLREQPFHRENASIFSDYEELGGGVQRAVYDKSFIEAYLQHCRDKASKAIAAESAETLSIRPGFDWLKFTRAEVHVYNIRHIHPSPSRTLLGNG